MAKHRQGPALFDVFDRNAAPSAPKIPNGPEKTEEIRQFPPEIQLSKQRSAIGDADASITSTVESDQPDSGSRPWARFQNDQLVLTLSSKRSAIALFGLLTLCALFYLLGERWSGRAYRRGVEAGKLASQAQTSNDEIQALQSRPPTPGVLDGLLPGHPAKTSTKSPIKDRARSSDPGSTWIDGMTYVVVQEFALDRREDAGVAQEFLTRRGVPTELVARSDGGIFLVATAGYNLKDSVQKGEAEKFLEKIHSLGAEYYASGGRYRLKGYFKTMTGSDW